MLWQGIKQHFQVRLNGCEKAIETFITNPYWGYFFLHLVKMKTERSKLQHDMLYTEASLNGFYDFL